MVSRKIPIVTLIIILSLSFLPIISSISPSITTSNMFSSNEVLQNTVGKKTVKILSPSNLAQDGNQENQTETAPQPETPKGNWRTPILEDHWVFFAVVFLILGLASLVWLIFYVEDTKNYISTLTYSSRLELLKNLAIYRIPRILLRLVLTSVTLGIAMFFFILLGPF